MGMVIEIQGLWKSFGEKQVIRDIDLNIESGKSFVVIGASGTGKSVLIKCILGLLDIDKDVIKINGKNIKKLNQKKLLQTLLKCGVLYQGSALFDSMNVIENISFGLIYGYHQSAKEAHKIAIEKLEAVDLDESIAYLSPAELSGGMKKRVALARALATNPDIIFFDEPTTGLDPITSGTINNLIVKCTKSLGISALSITHDLQSLRAISDMVGLLFDGNFIWTGSTQELDTTDNPYVRQFISGSQNEPFTSHNEELK